MVHPPMTHLKGFDLLALGFMTFALFSARVTSSFLPVPAWRRANTYGRGFRLPPYRCRPAVADGGRPGPGRRRYWPPDPADRAARGSGVRHRRLSCHRPAVRHPAYSRGVLRMGVAPFTGDGGVPLLIYTVAYFSVVLFLVLNRVALSTGSEGHHAGAAVGPAGPGGAAIFAPAGEIGSSSGEYQSAPLVQGLPAGALPDHGYPRCAGLRYRHRHRHSRPRHQRQPAGHALIPTIAGVIAATGLSLVYLALFYLGATSQGIAGDAQNGVQILTAYVQQTFGVSGSLLLAVVITLACLTTAVGLITACGEFFSDLLRFRTRRW